MCQYLQDVADTGVDPLPLMKESVKVTHSKEGVQLLWASCREVYNVIKLMKLELILLLAQLML